MDNVWLLEFRCCPFPFHSMIYLSVDNLESLFQRDLSAATNSSGVYCRVLKTDVSHELQLVYVSWSIHGDFIFAHGFSRTHHKLHQGLTVHESDSRFRSGLVQDLEL